MCTAKKQYLQLKSIDFNPREFEWNLKILVIYNTHKHQIKYIVPMVLINVLDGLTAFIIIHKNTFTSPLILTQHQ